MGEQPPLFGRPTGRPATLADVARLADVGESTVSRVLRGRGSFSADSAARVAEAVAVLGYVPNSIAGSLAGARGAAGTRLVGVVVPSLNNSVFADLLAGLTQAFDRAGFQCVIGVSGYGEGAEDPLVAGLLSWRPTALVLAGLEHTDATRARLRSSGLRIAELMDVDGAPIDLAVGFSNIAVGRASAEQLLACGYRRIGYVGHDLSRDLRAAKRLAGFEQALGAAGLALVDLEVGAPDTSAAHGREGLERLLRRSPDLDAVYFSNDDMAMGGYFHCLANGLSVPGRLALFGFNGLEAATALPQPLSTVRTPRRRIGEATAERLLSAGPPGVVDLGFELVAGATA